MKLDIGKVVAVIGGVAILGAAYLFRFEPVLTDSGGTQTAVWDRWRHQPCVYFRFPVDRMVCSQEDVDRYRQDH